MLDPDPYQLNTYGSETLEGRRSAGDAVPGPETLSLVTPAGWAAGLLGLVGLTGSRSFSQGGHNHCTKTREVKNRKINFKK
jgi:hypothetical protein